MNNFILAVKRFINDEEGVTAIEYGLIAALIAVVIITAVAAIGTNLNAVFNCVQNKLADSTYVCP